MSLAGQIVTPERDNAALAALDTRIDAVEADLGAGVPRGEIERAEQVGPVFITDADGETTLFGLAFNVAASRKIRAIGSLRAQGKSGDTVIYRLRDDDTGDELQARKVTFGIDDEEREITLLRTLSGEFTGLAAGEHTINVTAEVTIGSGPAGIQGSSGAPSILCTDDMGPG
jgi:hypothetical protein